MNQNGAWHLTDNPAKPPAYLDIYKTKKWFNLCLGLSGVCKHQSTYSSSTIYIQDDASK